MGGVGRGRRPKVVEVGVGVEGLSRKFVVEIDTWQAHYTMSRCLFTLSLFSKLILYKMPDMRSQLVHRVRVGSRR